jgi:hypothetical protein
LQIFAGDLFDFEMEVEPMLEVLVGRCLEQGLMEVQEEKQLEHLRCHQVYTSFNLDIPHTLSCQKGKSNLQEICICTLNKQFLIPKSNPHQGTAVA